MVFPLPDGTVFCQPSPSLRPSFPSPLPPPALPTSIRHSEVKWRSFLPRWVVKDIKARRPDLKEARCEWKCLFCVFQLMHSSVTTNERMEWPPVRNRRREGAGEGRGGSGEGEGRGKGGRGRAGGGLKKVIRVTDLGMMILADCPEW